MDLVLLSVLVGVAMAVAARLFWFQPALVRFVGVLAFAELAALGVAALAGFSPFYFVSQYLMMTAFAVLGSLIGFFYARPVFAPSRPGPYSLKILLGLALGLVVYLGYWLFLQRTGLVDELPVAPRQILLAFAALGLLIVLGYSAAGGILRTYWPPVRPE